MKRFIIIAIFMLFLVGCAKTPNEAIIKDKNIDVLLDNAKQYGSTVETNINHKTVSEILPTTCKEILIKVDAEIICPESEMPIVRVQASNFDQDTIDYFWKNLIGDIEMWQSRDRMTKAEVEQEIINLKSLISQPENKDKVSYLQDRISIFEKIYATAPNSIEDIRSTGKLEERKVKDGDTIIGSYDCLEAYEFPATSSGIEFYVRNNDDLKDTYIRDNSYRPVIRDASMQYVGNMRYLQGVQQIILDNDIPDDAKQQIHIRPKEALNQVNQILQGYKRDAIVAQDVYLTKDNNDSEEKFTYTIICNRYIDGINCAFYNGSSTTIEEYGKIWDYEKIIFQINDDGIHYMCWISPVKLQEYETKAATIKTYDEAYETFKNYMKVKYDYNNEDYISIEYTINQIKLELQRISEPNKFGSGLMVPVWNFYGYARTEDINGIIVDNSPSNSANYSTPLITINAVDLTMIDPNVGY